MTDWIPEMATDSSAQIVAESLKISAASGAELVKNISFTLGRERVALVGESGSGKSLTARALMGLLALPCNCRRARSASPAKTA